MTKEAELLPCPFCGGVPEFVMNRGAAGYPDRWDVCCSDCDASSDAFADKEEAIEKWNTRTTPPTAQGWLPIESAPKDGSSILLLSVPYENDTGPNGVHWMPAKVAIGHWWPEGDSWVDEMGRPDCRHAYTLAVTGVWLSGGGWFQPDEVSHWQPLPPPPTTEVAKD